MTQDQDEAMLYLQRLMTATVEINEVLANHSEAIAELLATHKSQPIWMDELERAREAIGACIQRSKNVLLEKARALDPDAIRALGRTVKEMNRKDRELIARAKRGALSEEEKLRILKDYLK
jgi:hypothetical protein